MASISKFRLPVIRKSWCRHTQKVCRQDCVNPSVHQGPIGRNSTNAEPDQGSKVQRGPKLQNPTVHQDPIWQHSARAQSAELDPGATLQNPTRAYSAEPDLKNHDPSGQPASQCQSQPASHPVDRDPRASQPLGSEPTSQPATAWRLAGCLSWVTPVPYHGCHGCALSGPGGGVRAGNRVVDLDVKIKFQRPPVPCENGCVFGGGCGFQN